MKPKLNMAVLRWAVREAAAWEGSLTGDPDPSGLIWFQTRIKQARESLRAVREIQAQIKRIKP